MKAQSGIVVSEWRCCILVKECGKDELVEQLVMCTMSVRACARVGGDYEEIMLVALWKKKQSPDWITTL